MELYKVDDKIELHKLSLDESYGMQWPEGTSQLVKELTCFRLSRHGKKPLGVKSTYYHGINIVRMLWSNEDVCLSVRYREETIWNNYFFNAFSALCRGRSICLTGPASASKTFAVAVYFLISFYSGPDKTMCMISTTSGGAAERRVWGEVKNLHRKAKFNIWIKFTNQNQKIGEVIDYLKCITFDENKELQGGTKNQRDLRNGLIVIPVANDSTGQHALDTIMGTHTDYVLWCVDEMPAMMDGIMRPRSNLISNMFFQFIGIGNADTKSDPHGRACEPIDGWETINQNTDRFWQGKTLDVLFLHGEESPNDHPAVKKDECKEPMDFPFPYLSNAYSRREIALVEGNGDYDLGKQTIGYNRFAIGFWYGDDVSNTILSAEFVNRFKANQSPQPFGHNGFTTYWSLDPAFASGGDANSLTFIKVGVDVYGHMQVVFPQQSIEIRPLASNREDYRKLVADEVVKQCKLNNASPQNGTYEATGDGGMVGDEVSKAFGQMVTPVSALEPSRNERYKNIITDYWFSVREIIATGMCRGFNINSNYAKELFMRHYHNTGNGKVEVEQKKEMKKRLKRSCDNGDSTAQCCKKVLESVSLIQKPLKEFHRKIPDYLFQLTETKEEFADRWQKEYGESVL